MKFLHLIGLIGLSQAIHVEQAANINNHITDDVPRSSSDQDTANKISDNSKSVDLTNVADDGTKAQSLDSVDSVEGHGDDFGADPVDELNKALQTKSKVTFQSPDINFGRPYDHIGHQEGLNQQDAARVNFKVIKAAPFKHQCIEGDWAVVHYHMWSKLDGSLLEDTDELQPDNPLIFLVGGYQVSKCFDIAIQQMRNGETALVECPNDLDIGGGIQNEWHNKFGFRWVDSKIDTQYKITLIDCGVKPEYMSGHGTLEELKDGFPFYLLSANQDADGNKMAVTVCKDDKYAPKVTGVHNVHLSLWSGKTQPNLDQQWVWNTEEKNIVSVGMPGKALFEGFNKNIIAYTYRGLPNQRFKYDIGTKRFENTFTGYAVDVKADVIKPEQNILANEPDTTKGQQWVIEYQAEHGHDHD